MKKFLFIFCVLSAVVYGQENSEKLDVDVRQNEISINLPISIFAEFPMISYERLSSPDLGFGASAGFTIGNDFDDSLNFEIIPFVRWYFLNTGNETMYGRKFFIEANAGIIGYENEEYNPNTNHYDTEDKVGFGLGAGVGYKYVNTSNWMGTIYLGGGKNFSADDGDLQIYPHFGINIGKRF